MDEQQAARIERKLDRVLEFIDRVEQLVAVGGWLGKFKAVRKVAATPARGPESTR